MNILRHLLTIGGRDGQRTGGSRFDRYYGDVIRAGVGYPTADEARRDLATQNTVVIRHGLFR